MENSKQQELCLQGLFLHLVERGFRLNVRDYIDALKALRAGYGTLRRSRLLWLCQTLWARTEEEIRYLHLLFDRIPYPTPEEVGEITGETIRKVTDADQKPSPPSKEMPKEQQALGVNFSFTTQRGLELPRAQVSPIPGEDFILAPKPVIPLRDFIVVFRRFRRAMRTGPKVELDMGATIDKQCRTGLLEAPVFVSARCNQACLTVLVDVSGSMVAWRPLNKVLRTALRHSQLGGWAIFYFDNVPEEVLFEEENLYRPRPIDTVIKERSDTSLLIISDGGAARGFRSRSRIQETENFLAAVRRTWRPMAWLNPMPQHRWKGTSAQAIRKRTNMPMFELTEGGLIQAIDVLRGTKLPGG